MGKRCIYNIIIIIINNKRMILSFYYNVYLFNLFIKDKVLFTQDKSLSEEIIYSELFPQSGGYVWINKNIFTNWNII